MTKLSRKYQQGDEKYINYLYHLITGTERTATEYAWEWINTWHGPGSVWLVFDDTREPDDQLIAQYSIIPTPFSFWGKPYLAGKTENCMSHPAFRGKGLYFFHEQKYFEQAKERFQLFFTTTGDVAKGAPGKVRQKLGYRAFDHWITMSCWLSASELELEIESKLPGMVKRLSWINRVLVKTVTRGILIYSHPGSLIAGYNLRLFSEAEAPLKQIETMWQSNAQQYGISVDRTAEYLQWRINDNPYVTHHYLCCYQETSLQGVLIYTAQDRTIYIVDIFADEQKKSVFKALLNELQHLGAKQNHAQIKCYTSSRNLFLIKMMKAGNFLNFANLFSIRKTTHPKQLFIYVSESIQTEHDPWDGQHWYITDLIKEGRPYTARPIG